MLEQFVAAEIINRLSETIAWCSRHARATDAGVSTRTAILRPPVMSRPPLEILQSLIDVPYQAQEAVEFVCESRRRELVRIGIVPDLVGLDMAGGRILCTTIDTDACAAATGPSNGFFDENDLPGWDTWFYHRTTHERWGAIYCWVPPQLVELANSGMICIPVQSVGWLQSINELSDSEC